MVNTQFKTLIAWIFCCIGLWVSVPAFAQERLTATPDRSVMAENETLTLTVRLENTSRSASPDFSPLSTNFDILGSNQTSQYMNNNGQVTSYVQWTVSLAPKQTGKLLIPPLTVGDTQSQPIAITVTAATEAIQGTQAAFLETTLSSQDVFVQEQFVVTAKLFVSENIIDFNAESFAVPNADIQELPRSQYQTTIGDTLYAVYELRFAVTPSASGQLDIPSYLWTLQTSAIAGSRFGYNQGRPNMHRLKTKAFSLNVKPRPENYPANAPWLPARELTLSASWSQNPPQFTVGEPITRSITMTTKGLSGDQLPPLELNLNDSEFKVYPDQPKIESSTDQDGKKGTRTQSMAIVPNKAGQMTLPAVELTWWNTETNQLETALLPAETINVMPATATNGAPATAILPPITTPLPQAAPTATTQTLIQTNAGWWPWLCALLGALNLLQLGRWFWGRKKNAGAPLNTPRATVSPLDAAIQAAITNNANACHQALSAWCRKNHPQTSPRQALQKIGASDAAIAQLDQLDAFLFKGKQTSAWNGQQMAQQLKQLGLQKKNSEPEGKIPSLYPA